MSARVTPLVPTEGKRVALRMTINRRRLLVQLTSLTSITTSRTQSDANRPLHTRTCVSRKTRKWESRRVTQWESRATEWESRRATERAQRTVAASRRRLSADQRSVAAGAMIQLTSTTSATAQPPTLYIFSQRKSLLRRSHASRTPSAERASTRGPPVPSSNQRAFFQCFH